MTVQTRIDHCLLKASYTEQTACLSTLKESIITEGVFAMGLVIMASIVVLGCMMYIHSKVRSKK